MYDNAPTVHRDAMDLLHAIVAKHAKYADGNGANASLP